jgi:hypothetical protein
MGTAALLAELEVKDTSPLAVLSRSPWVFPATSGVPCPAAAASVLLHFVLYHAGPAEPVVPPAADPTPQVLADFVPIVAVSLKPCPIGCMTCSKGDLRLAGAVLDAVAAPDAPVRHSSSE